MFSFSEIVGHEQIKEHMQAAIRDKKPFHAYLFQGEEGVGKEALARTFAAGLQCQSESADKPCKECVSCRQMESGNQPDVIWVTREKASLGVDEIREQLCNTMDIKPFSSPYKIYLVPEAEKMTEAAQNALLKTIEEPEYGIVILMTSNISALLPTIQSRCLTMEFRPLSTAVVESYVKEHCQVPDYQARASAAFAQGNLGKAMRYAKSEDFIERKDHIISLLRHVEQMDLSEMLAVIKDLGTRKDEVRDYIDLMVLWYRDVLLFKATKDINQLLFQDEASYISREASHRSYEKIEEILQAFEKAKVRLRANVNFDITMELMLLTLK